MCVCVEKHSAQEREIKGGAGGERERERYMSRYTDTRLEKYPGQKNPHIDK